VVTVLFLPRLGRGGCEGEHHSDEDGKSHKVLTRWAGF
jgi:hypothetical protein